MTTVSYTHKLPTIRNSGIKGAVQELLKARVGGSIFIAANGNRALQNTIYASARNLNAPGCIAVRKVNEDGEEGYRVWKKAEPRKARNK